jgi:WD40 repeat protein/serine/threonine protein kinase
MDPERLRLVLQIFEEAVDQPEAERAAFLAGRCGGDDDLRAEVEKLLASLPRAESVFRSALARDLEATARSLGAEEPGRQIGEYRLIRVIATGGMGAVYLAEHTDPALRMQVALKLVRPGLESAAILQRFVSERQLLAGLNHPHIARLLGGGATADGWPYLVMEYVDGRPLDRYCAENRLSVEERIGLVRTVCSAVHYAHRNLVVHRDLKPSNILVTADGAVKLLDFGIAKVLAPDGAVGSAGGAPAPDLTQTAFRALTPRYASPEQVRGGVITTATDVYSLGVILYQLLTGRLPHDTDGATPAELERIVCEEEVAAPSAAVEGEHAGTDPAAPPLEPPRLRQRLAGDLDTIVLKALRKEPDRRYASADELSDDLRRHLEGLPVSARPDTVGYRVSRFARRNRGLVAAAAAIALLLVTATTVSTILYRRANAARAVAEERTREAELLAYTSGLAAAESAIRGNQVAEARRQLEQAPEPLRGWEWRHLWSRLDRSEIAFPKRHGARVNAVGYSPDGTTIVSASADSMMVLWDVARRDARWFRKQTSWVEAAAVSPDGRFIAAATRDSAVAVCDAATGERLARVRTAALPTALGFDAAGRLLVGFRDGTIGRWAVPALSPLDLRRVHEAGVSCLALARDGTLAVGFWDGLVKVSAAGSWHSVRSIRAHQGRVTRMDVSPDGTRLATGAADTKVTVWDLGTGDEIITYHGFEGMVGAVLFSPDGTRVLASDSDGRLLTFDARTGERTTVLPGGPQQTVFVAASAPDSVHFAAGTVYGRVLLWRWDADDVRFLLTETAGPEMNYVLCAAPSPDGRLVASASRTAGVDVWDLATGRHLHGVEAPGARGASAVAFSPDGARLFAAHADGAISVTDAATGRLAATFAAHEAPRENQPAMDGSLVISALDVHPGGTLLATGGADRAVKVWEPSGLLRHGLTGHGKRVTGVRFRPDGAVLASCSSDSTIRLWEVESGRPGRVFADVGRVRDIAWSPDGRRIAAATLDGTVELWDAESGAKLGTLFDEEDNIEAVAFTADGRRLAIGGAAKTIWILDPIGRREIVQLQGHVGRIKSLRFSPGDRVLVSASIDGTVGLWDVVPPRSSPAD